MKPGSSPSVGIAATARILRRAALTAVVALASGAEPRAQTPGVEPTNEKPFQPVSVFDHPGGQYHAPPDSGGPPGSDTPTSGEGKPQQTSGEVARPSSHPGGDPKMAPAAAADGSRAPAAPITLLDLHPDSWETWWETNKFDFIELRRVDDPIRTTQGTTAESPARRELRLATVRAAVRDKVLPELRELTRSPDAGVRAASIVASASCATRTASSARWSCSPTRASRCAARRSSPSACSRRGARRGCCSTSPTTARRGAR
jgi:hypothetical protein